MAIGTLQPYKIIDISASRYLFGTSKTCLSIAFEVAGGQRKPATSVMGDKHEKTFCFGVDDAVHRHLP